MINQPPINMVTNGCITGIARDISQGEDWHNAKVAAFYSAKLNSAQQNYPVPKIEMLAGIETMLCHWNILQGTKFRWYTDHKGLVTLLAQRNLSGRQAHWLEKISEFDFEVVYVPGAKNILSDALSRIYLQDAPSTVRARSEYTYHDVINNDALGDHLISMPLLVGKEGVSMGFGCATKDLECTAARDTDTDSEPALQETQAQIVNDNSDNQLNEVTSLETMGKNSQHRGCRRVPDAETG